MTGQRMRAVCLTLLLGITPAWATDQDTIQTVLEKYQTLVEEAHILEARVTLQVLTIHKHMVSDDHKPLFESLFSLPYEDPLYNKTPLFFQSGTLMEWDLILNGVTMTIAQQIQSTDTYIAGQDFRVMDQLEFDRKLHARKDRIPLQRYTIEEENESLPSPMWPLIAPADLVDRHYLPSMWYPSVDDLYLPESFEAITLRGGTMQPYVLQYTPSEIPEDFLIFLRYLSGIPDLQANDLRCITEFDDQTGALLSFGVCIQEGLQRHYLFQLIHRHTGRQVYNLPYPDLTTLSVSAEVEVNEEPEWRMHYMGQFQITQMEGLN